MEILMIFILIYLILMLFPFLLAYRSTRGNNENYSLVARSNNIKDARYFAKSFKSKLLKSLDTNQSSGDVILSKIEPIMVWDNEYEDTKFIDKICIFDKKADIDNKVKFKKEIYAKDDIEIVNKASIRAVAGEKNVIIGEKSKVIRWVDAEKILVLKEFADAGVSATAAERLVIENGCSFKRLYAPVIEVRKYVELIDQSPDEITINRKTPVYTKIERNIKKLEEGEVLKKSIATKYKLVLEAGSTVCGDIKADKNIHIKANSIITGNIFSEGNIVIERGVKIFGNIFAGKNIYIGPDVQIGKLGRVKSVVARLSAYITIGTVIYGYVGTETGGKIFTAEDFALEVKKRAKIKILEKDVMPKDEFGYVICNYTKDGCLTFKSVEEYEDIDYYAFRDNTTVKYVVIPPGAKSIRASMFYNCENLETVYIPDTVKEIGEYAFYKCKNLKEVEFDEGCKLKSIGQYAFSECENLVEFNVEYVEELQDGVFRNDNSLERFNVLDGYAGIKYGDGVFQNCSNLELEIMTK